MSTASGNLRLGSREFTVSYEPETAGDETAEPAGGLPENGESLVSGDQLEEVVYGPPAPHWLPLDGLLLEEESNGAVAVAVGDEAASIRGVSFRPEEEITHVFSPTDGLTEMVPASGPVLLLTQERLVAFCHADARRETYLVPVAEVKHVVVKSGSRSATNVAQGILMVIAGIFIYLALGYWLAGQLGGPTIPVLNMDISSLIALVLVVSGMGILAQVYFARLDGAITFQGEGLQFTFPFRGSSAQRHAFDMVNTTFEARRLKLSDPAEPDVAVDEGRAEPDAAVGEGRAEPDAAVGEGRAEPDAAVGEGRAEPDAAVGEGRAEPDAAVGEGRAEPDAAVGEGRAEPDAAVGEGRAEPDAAVAEGPAEPDAAVDEGRAEPDAAVAEAVVDYDDVEPAAMAREDGAGESAAGGSAAGGAQPLGLRASAQE